MLKPLNKTSLRKVPLIFGLDTDEKSVAKETHVSGSRG